VGTAEVSRGAGGLTGVKISVVPAWAVIAVEVMLAVGGGGQVSVRHEKEALRACAIATSAALSANASRSSLLFFPTPGLE